MIGMKDDRGIVRPPSGVPVTAARGGPGAHTHPTFQKRRLSVIRSGTELGRPASR